MSIDKNLESQPIIYPQYINAYPVEDEISLIDVWIALAKFRKVFVVSFLLLLVIGSLIITLFKSDNYSMTTTIDIGQVEKGGSVQLLQSPSAVVSQINLSLVPKLTRELADQSGMDLFETEVSNPKDTNLVTIQNKVNEAERPVIAQFQNGIAESILADHKELSRVLNSRLEQQLNAEKLALKKLKDPRELVKLTDFERVALHEEKIKLLKFTDANYLADLKKNFDARMNLYQEKVESLSEKNELLKSQLESKQQGGDVAAQRTLIQDELSENRLIINEAEEKKLAVEQERNDFLIELNLNAAKQKTLIESLESEIELIESNWKVAIEQKEGKIAELENQLLGNNTRVVSLAELSLKPVGLTKELAYLICLVLALMGALFFTLAVMFREKVKEKMASEA